MCKWSHLGSRMKDNYREQGKKAADTFWKCCQSQSQTAKSWRCNVWFCSSSILVVAISNHQTDSYIYIWQVFCPALRTIPKSQQLSRNYLPEVHEQHMTFIMLKIADQKICCTLKAISQHTDHILILREVRQGWHWWMQARALELRR